MPDRYILGLGGKHDIPVAAGADVSEGYFRYAELGYPHEQRYWPETIDPLPNDLEVALLEK